ncbi:MULTISPECIES: hypothetical protein [Sphingomonadaceae]|uniref:hypothetical protein n=1 Tax=Sphingomonadaceae TaxID=41297 RepID=UPI00115873FC|nr:MULTISPECIES: hypothetical protein [Sphingomonadaceae]QDK35891.1 hypothetical protein DM450_24545 [Sphingomonas sp. IC081]GFE77360.1 hypothetical protein NTCA1_50090 [Novosphingobium sp. TCA1]
MKTFEEAKLSPEIIQSIQTSIERRVDGHDIQAFLKGLVILSAMGGSGEFTRKQIVAEVDPIRTEFTSNVWADEKKLRRQFDTHRAYLSEGVPGLLEFRCDQDRRPYRYRLGVIEEPEQEVPFQLAGSILRYRTGETVPRLSRLGRLTHPGVGLHAKDYRRWLFLTPLIVLCVTFMLFMAALSLALYSAAKGVFAGPMTYLALLAVPLGCVWSLSQRWNRLFTDRILLLGMGDVADVDGGVVLNCERGSEGRLAIVIRRYFADCPICDAETVMLARGGLEYPGRIVGRCQNSPREHVFSFDRVTLEGAPLRQRRRDEGKAV